tara:strand:+ start:55 stop:231 length:177 start_codon:yes stop_codon:yes gene_type:complete
MTNKYNIAEHWDAAGIITANSNAETEFKIFQNQAVYFDSAWTGDEFSLKDFEAYIASI